jgi:3-deoxy-D-manno-octulosonate 8-phosphate phosphatase (KDO 8-P phosphatase)
VEIDLKERAKKIKLVLTDVDGVLTDGGVFYGADGEVMKRFNIRDGMGVERLREVGVDVGFITGEKSESVARRAEKLQVEILHLYCKDKPAVVRQLMQEHGLAPEEIAYIGDDVNDVEAMKLVGLPAAPADALLQARDVAKFVCHRPGGAGAFRELCEFIIDAKKGEERAAGGFGFAP